MSLYANTAVVKRIIETYCEVRQCKHCDRFFNELESVGMHKCEYHPGEYDKYLQCYTCCGEKRSLPNLNNPYSAYSHVMTWKPHARYDHGTGFSKGCKRRDCVATNATGIDPERIMVDEIASLVPYMKPPLKKRPGFRKAPLRIVRQEEFPYNVWYHPPRR